MSITLTAVISNVSLNVTVELCVSPLILPQHVQLKNHGIRGICSAEVSKSFADRIRYMFDLNSIYVLYTWFNSTRCVHPRLMSAAEFDRGGKKYVLGGACSEGPSTSDVVCMLPAAAAPAVW